MNLSLCLLLCVAGGLVAAHQDDSCDMGNNVNRFDCYPETNANEEGCLSRGCCWRAPVSDLAKDLNIPYCYYPRGYQGYTILNGSTTDNGFELFLERKKPSGVDQDVPIVKMEYTQQTDYIARVRIIDAAKARWEPPLPKIPSPSRNRIPDYTYTLLKDPKFVVSRYSPQGPGQILASFDFSTLVFTDTFIQLTSDLASNVVYGLGEHKGSLRRSMNFTRFTFYNQDRAPEDDKRLYGTHPLYVNMEKDGKANGMWLFNSNAMDIILQPTPAITYRPVGGILDFFIFVGPTPADVVRQYQEIVGKPKMPPYWGLGFHLCRWGYKNTSDTRDILKKNIDAGVRIDVQWNDIDYMNERNDFTLDPKNYGDLGGFVDELHKEGRHYVMIVDPAVSGSEKAGSYPPFDRGVEYDVFVKNSSGGIVYGKVWNLKSSVFPDFTHPNATPYWTEMFSNFHKKIAYDGAWIDMNEPSNAYNGHVDGCPSDSNKVIYTPGDEALPTRTLCNSDVQHWSTHYNVHNMYGYTEAISTYKALSTVRPNKRPFIISRASFSGQGFYSGHWTGDIFSTWTDLKDSVPGILGFSFYGIPLVGADICGFDGSATVDLCARWQALGAFYPFSRNHNTIGAKAQDPASMGEKVVNATKNTYYWRYKLLPYLYTLFYRAHVHGTTVARPLFFNYPEDTNTYDNDDQFFWGEAVMVVPALYENQKTIDAYFPKGIWYDLQNRTGTVDASKGGKKVELQAYWDTINFFMKGGEAVFFQEPGQTTTDSRMNPFGVYVFLNEHNNATGELFIDDGESIDSVQKKNYRLVEVIATDKIVMMGTSDGKPTPFILNEIQVHGVRQAPKQVTLNMQPFYDYSFDSAKGVLTVHNINTSMNFIAVMFE